MSLVKPYFTRKEIFATNTPDEINQVLNNETLFNNLISILSQLIVIRESYSYPIKINSLYRDSSHNVRVGGSSTSQHLQAEAVDICPLYSNGLFDDGIGGVSSLLSTIKQLTDKKAITLGQIIYYPNRGFIHISLPYRKNGKDVINQFLTIK